MSGDAWLDVGWALALAAWLLCEFMGIRMNKRMDAEGEPRSYRTFTEILRWVFAFGEDGEDARLRGLRRFLGLASLVWFVVHIVTTNFV